MKPPLDFILANQPTPARSFQGLRLQKALYRLKQARRAWYLHLRRFFTDKNFTCHSALPCIIVLHKEYGYPKLAVYVNNINLVGTPSVCTEVENLVITRFEMKLIGRTTFCLGLQVDHHSMAVFFYTRNHMCTSYSKRSTWRMPTPSLRQ